MKEISIQPSVSVYSQFKYRSYKIYKALAEYIDNSTQSYFNNKNRLGKLVIEINWTDNEITILDNAFGMDENEMMYAMRLGEEPKEDSGRNQFGMGLKTASCWFSDYWIVESSTLGNNKAYKIEFDLKAITRNNKKKIQMHDYKYEANKSFTKISLKKLTRKINGSAHKNLKKILSSTYKADLKDGEIAIYLQGEKLKYETPKIWSDSLYDEKMNICPFNFEFKYEGKEQKICGWAAIAATGDTSEHSRGFDLIKNNRVITPNVKPEILVGRTNSFTYQRLFGEIKLKTLDVTQDKSDFTWDDALKDLIFTKISKEIKELKKRANSLRVRDKKNISKEQIEIIDKNSKPKIKFSDKIYDDTDKKMIKKYKELKPRAFEHWGVEYKCEVILTKEMNKFVELEEYSRNKNEIKVKIYINTEHSFLSPILNNADRTSNIVDIILAKTISEKRALDTVNLKASPKDFNEKATRYFESILRLMRR